MKETDSTNGCLATKPTNISYEEATMVSYGGLLALQFMEKGNIQRGQKVLVYGASGTTGTTAIQYAKYLGAKVTAVCSTANVELVKSLGADKAIDYTKEDFAEGEEHYDIVLDAVAKIPKSRCKKVLAPNGIYISAHDRVGEAEVADLVFLTGLVKTGKLKAIIDRTYPLEQIVEAHRYIDKGHKKGNVVITVGDRS
jgi:NADPH:quinone reductase-like Zn-dependent oxidoreductase